MVQSLKPSVANNDTTTPPPIPNTAAPKPEGEMARVRQIILGPEAAQQRLQGAEVDRLRQVIFGAQMEDYDRRFADMRREIDRALNDLRVVQDSVTEFEKNQTKRIEALEQEMRRTNDELRREIEHLSAREPLVQKLTTRVQQQEIQTQATADRVKEMRDIHAQTERELSNIKAQIGESREQHERKLDALKREVRQSEDTLRAELRRITDRLGDQKTDRKALAAMLMEVATRLETGSTVTGLLEELTSASRE